MPGEIPDEFLDLMAGKFKLLAEATRLAILRTLMKDGERNVTQVAEATGRTQANVSKHLKALNEAKMVARRKEGLQVYYRLSDPVVERICRLVCESLLQESQGQSEQGAPEGGGS